MALDPGGFASLRAEVEVGGDIPDATLYASGSVTDWLTATSGSARGQASRPAHGLSAGRELYTVGLKTQGAGQLQETASLSRHNHQLLWGLASTFALDGQAAVSARAAGLILATLPSDVRRGVPLELGQLAYPRPFLDLLKDTADEFDLDPLFLYAVMRQESAFDPLAHSSADARGLTQVIPPTARAIAGALGHDPFVIDDLFKPAVSIRFGAYYLARQLEAFDGNMYAALAAYNGGPGNADRWGQDGGFADPDVFVSHIDLRETYNYVRLVMEHYAHYRAIYDGWRSPTLLGLDSHD